MCVQLQFLVPIFQFLVGVLQSVPRRAGVHVSAGVHMHTCVM